MKRRRRLVILLALLPVYIWLLMVVGLIAVVLIVDPDAVDSSLLNDVIDPRSFANEIFVNPAGWAYVVLPATLLALSQLAFVLPAFGTPVRMERGRGRPLWKTLLAAGLVGGILTVGLMYALGEVLQLWSDADPWPWGFVAERDWDIGLAGGAIFWGQVLVGWAIWTVILLYATRRSDPKRLHNRLAIVLLGGTILEVLITVPIDIMVRRRTDCYCATGTFFALCCGVWATLWLAGPGIILAVTTRRRRSWGETHCLSCGYAKGPSPSMRCSECGYEWIGQRTNDGGTGAGA
jgi:hypothetical protein